MPIEKWMIPFSRDWAYFMDFPLYLQTGRGNYGKILIKSEEGR